MVAELRSQNVFPQSGNVPVFHKLPTIPVGWARVDDWALPTVLSVAPWYVADLREPTTPRTYLRLTTGPRKLLPLARLVVGLMQNLAQGMTYEQVGQMTREEIYNLTRSFSRVGFVDRNPYNCVASNLMLPTSLNVLLRPEGPTTVPLAPALVDELPPPTLEDLFELGPSDPSAVNASAVRSILKRND